MARTDNLKNYLTDVAQAIKDKKGDQTEILASEFDTEIQNLPSGGDDVYNYISDTIEHLLSGSVTYDISNTLIQMITKLPPFKTKNNSTFQSLFRNLEYITEIPEIDFSGITKLEDVNQMCYNCVRLKDISNLAPLFDKFSDTITNIDKVFYGCKNLTDFSILQRVFESGNLTSCNSVFGNCTKLTNIPFTLNLINATGVSSVFINCEKLEQVPEIILSDNLKNCDYFFSGCKTITTIPELKLASCTSFQYMFQGAESLVSIPKLNFSSATNIRWLFSGNYPNLTDLGGFESLGFSYNQKTQNYDRYALTLSGCPNLTHESLMNVINNLYDLNLAYEGETQYTQQLILGTTNLAKLSEEEIAIATGKGWSIT